MSFVKTKGFKYFKNLIIGVGAGVVLVGALAKILSHPWADFLLTVGMLTEAFIFCFLGIIGPEPDYYWHKLYPGLDDYHSRMQPLTQGPLDETPQLPGLNGEVVESRLSGMLTELQSMSKSLASLKALQEVDFSGTKDQIKAMNNFYTQMTEAMANLGESLEDTKRYKEQMVALNKNLSSLNSVYGNMLTAIATGIGNRPA